MNNGEVTVRKALFETNKDSYENHRAGIFSIRKSAIILTLGESIVHDIISYAREI